MLFLRVHAFSHFIIYNPRVQGTYVDQGINSTMTYVHHTRRVTRMQLHHWCTAHEYRSHAGHEILHACGPLRLTRVSLDKN